MLWIGIAIGLPLGVVALAGLFCLSLHLSYLRTTANPPWYAQLRI